MKQATRADWNTEPMPEKRVSIQLDRLFTDDEIKVIRKGLIPKEMEDKWFVFWENDRLYFHRSWTGLCIYEVEFVRENGGYRMVSAFVNRDPEQYKRTDDEGDRYGISFLIDEFLLS